MISSEGSLIAVEPNHGEVVRVNPRTGNIARIADISATQGHIVPTVVAERRGALYLSSLGTFPGMAGSQKILRISRAGNVTAVASGFTAVLGLDFDARGRLYVLEMGESPVGFPAPNVGRVIRLDGNGNRVVIVEGLFLPTGLRIGPDGWLYISNKGFGPPQPGEILRVDIRGSGDGDTGEDMERGDR
jgi:sugar lactone lactonase YvrE